MKLYLIHRCPFGHRAAMVMREKKLDFDIVFYEAKARPPELARAGPYAKSPTLVDGEALIYDSLVVLEYLEERFPQPRLLPESAPSRAEVRSFITRIEDELMPTLGGVVGEALKPSPDPEKLIAAHQGFVERLGIWDERLRDREFAVGPTMTLADVVLYTPFVAIRGLTQRDIPERYSQLRAWLSRIQARPAAALPAPA